MSITDHLDMQLRATNEAELGTSGDFVGTQPALKLFFGVKETTLDLSHYPTELDALRKLEDYQIRPKQRMKNIWSSNLKRKSKSCVMVPAWVMKIKRSNEKIHSFIRRLSSRSE